MFSLLVMIGSSCFFFFFSTSIQVPIGEVNDPYDEPQTENVTFELKGASQNLVVDAENKTRAHAITDNDDPPVIQFKVSTSDVVEGVGTATIEVELTEESQLPITIGYQRVAGDTATADDATVSGNSLSFAPRVAGCRADCAARRTTIPSAFRGAREQGAGT